ncbi:MAG: cytochrome c biogenesis protein CcsA [Betaproteobacteria bacterium]
MILLHLAVAALYAAVAWALVPPPPAAAGSPSAPSSGPAAWAGLLLPAAIALHAWAVWHDIAAPDGLDISLVNALSAVAGLVAAVAWGSGLLRTLPVVGTVVLPVAAISAVLPAFFENPHRFPYAGEPWAALHVAVALAAYALFLVAALQALVLMGLEKRLHRRLPDPGAAALPPLLTLERFLFRLVGAGFLLLTATLASGMLFSEQLFGRPFVFNHKSVFSVLGWLTFGALLWGRHRYGWRGRVALRWILAGTAFVFLAYLGSKFVLEVLLGR